MNIIYTTILNGYDELIEPSVVTEGWKYICFTNDENLKSNIWDIRVVEMDKYLNATKNNRKIKIQYYRYLKEKYDLCIYIDGKIGINCNLNYFLEKNVEDLNNKEIDMFLIKHHKRDCIYQEIERVEIARREDAKILKLLRKFYKKEKYPEHIGLYDNCLLIRRYPDNNMIQFMDKWWDMVERWSRRDQLSFCYVLWKNKDLIKISTIDVKINHFHHSIDNCFSIYLHKKRWPKM